MKNSVVSEVQKLAEEIAKTIGLEIWDVRYLKEGSSQYLRIFIDKPEGVTVEDCEKMSKAIDAPLDELDPISVPYCLEVSSPGIERELVKREHFEKFVGSKINVRLIRPEISGEREVKGTLLDFCDGIIKIELNNNSIIEIDKKDTSWVRLDDFN